MTVADLGPRLCIMGPSNSGKSTLAAAIAQGDGRAAVHLDQLHHMPGSAWIPRPPGEFASLHREAIAGERWVIEGNYSVLLPARLARATGLILLDLPTALGLWRYVRRTLWEGQRHGSLAGAPERVRWAMLRHIVVTTPANRRRYRAILPTLTIPTLSLPTRAALAAFYRGEDLRR